jgi:hypothetical protein
MDSKYFVHVRRGLWYSTLALCAGCTSSHERLTSDVPTGAAVDVPSVAQPGNPADMPVGPVLPDQPEMNVTGDRVVTTVAEAQIIDTRTWAKQIDDSVWVGEPRRIKNYLPPHERPPEAANEPANELPVGGLMELERAAVGPQFATISNTGWTPPDPSLAVGPDHVVVTVNQSIAFYTKAGTLQFSTILGSQGSPGFFESVGASTFTFDPKCFYDHLTGRFVVMCPEFYTPNQAWITIAVSDDSDPNGVWYKYRTNAVVTIGSTTYWWDYPGFGYDQNAFYVTCNLFSLSGNSFGGVGFRIFDKTPMLSGAPVTFSTLTSTSLSSVQSAQHFGSPQSPYFVSVTGTSTVQITAVRNPLTTPSLVTTSVTVPSYSSQPSSPVAGGDTVGAIGNRMMNAVWRDGRLAATHAIGSGGRSLARWYEFNTNNWPTSGSVTLIQSGNIDPGGTFNTFFPAIYSNRHGDLGIVVGRSSSTTQVAVGVAGRKQSDALGTMGALTIAKAGEANNAGRWGDYYDMAVDPNNDSTFWAIGEYNTPSGWKNWVTSFVVTPCISDLTGNGITDFGDFLQFFNCYDNSLPCGDIDGNPGTDFGDFLAFFNAYDVGC